jgi:hypothetical protein
MKALGYEIITSPYECKDFVFVYSNDKLWFKYAVKNKWLYFVNMDGEEEFLGSFETRQAVTVIHNALRRVDGRKEVWVYQ